MMRIIFDYSFEIFSYVDDEEENAEISYSFATEVLFTSSKMQR